MSFRKVDVYTEFVILSDRCCLKWYAKSDLYQRFGETYNTRALYIAACQSELNVVLHIWKPDYIKYVALKKFLAGHRRTLIAFSYKLRGATER